MIRACTEQDLGEILEVISDAARAYKGVILENRFHDLGLLAGSDSTLLARAMR